MVRLGMDAQAKTLHAIKLNCARRHLTTAGKQSAIQKALQAAPEKSDRQLARAIGVNHETVGAQRKELEESGGIRHFLARQDPRTGRLSQPASKPISITVAKPEQVAKVAAQAQSVIEKAAPETVAKLAANDINLVQAQREVKERAREQRREENRAIVQQAAPLAEVSARFATIVIDPPWDWCDEGDVDQMGRARPDYATMPYERLLALPVADKADTDCHLYLWITNRSLPKGFALLEAWGFRYITCLTWVKSLPDIVYKCQSCHNLFSSNDRGNEYGVQRHRDTEGARKESLPQNQAGRRKPEGESPEGLRILQKGLCSDSQEHEILREGVCGKTPIDGDGGEAPLARKPQPAQQGVDDINRLQIPVFAGTSNGEQAGVCGGTSTGYVGNPGASNSKRGACSSQKQGQDGQQTRELGASQRSGSHGDALDSPICRVPMLRTCHYCGGTLKEYRTPGNFGLGNYFRGQSEQVLFGVKGSQPLKRKDAGTVFHAPRGPQGHSSKPVEFYDFVESCSPGPYLEMFSRTTRNDWMAWGESA